MEIATKRMTAEKFFEVRDPERHTQLIDGVIVVTEAGAPHGGAQLHIASSLLVWTEQAPGRGVALPPVDVVLTEHDVYGPDVVWYRQATARARWDGDREIVPDLAVEVRSPSTWRYDIGRKKTVYERAGVPELWLVDTEGEAVLVYRRSRRDAPDFDVALELGAGERLESPMLPGFSVDVASLFRRP